MPRAQLKSYPADPRGCLRSALQAQNKRPAASVSSAAPRGSEHLRARYRTPKRSGLAPHRYSRTGSRRDPQQRAADPPKALSPQSAGLPRETHPCRFLSEGPTPTGTGLRRPPQRPRTTRERSRLLPRRLGPSPAPRSAGQARSPPAAIAPPWPPRRAARCYNNALRRK